MTNFREDVHRRTSTRLTEVIPDFVEGEYPQFVAFLTAYYRFLEQYDYLPITPTFLEKDGIVTVLAGNSVVTGGNTSFAIDVSAEQKVRVGADVFRVRSVASNTQLTVYEVPVRSYYANNYTVETDKTVRQASGALKQVLDFHTIETTLPDFIPYFRDTYLRDLPQGLSDTSFLVPKVLDFYQARGSEDAFRFLFRALYGTEITLTYPRDYTFRTSDGDFEVPTILKVNRDVSYANGQTVSADSLELRQIVGLQSNAYATVLKVDSTYDGPRPVASLRIGEIVVPQTEGQILLNSDSPSDDGDVLLVSTYGIPPNGNEYTVYDFALVQENASKGSFIAGETVSTLPLNDPLAIRGTVLGTVSAFTVVEGGSGYQLGDLVYPTGNTNGGYGAIGRVAGFANNDITGIVINSGGDGYYAGITLSVDSSGTGGTGLAGYVQNVSPGNILTAEGDILLFESGNTTYQASREKIDYYEIGITLADLVSAGISLSAPNWGDAVSPGNTALAYWGMNLESIIVSLTANLTVVPIYVANTRTEIGEIFAVNVTSVGANYTSIPTISVPRPFEPSSANGVALSTLIVPYEVADLEAVVALGQIGVVEVLVGGSGYDDTDAFTVNSTTSSSASGNGASLGMVLGTVSTGVGRFRNTKGQTSSDRFLQDVTKYQPFSYEIAVEQDTSKFGDAVKQFLHPAGALLLVRQTVTSVTDTSISLAYVSVKLDDTPDY